MTLGIIILAGGRGTRIRSILKETPKIMAPIAGKPFLEWLLLWINSWQIITPKKVLLSTCIGHKFIKDYCEKEKIDVDCVSEKRPLGTFGAIANVASSYSYENYLIINGDTIFKANIDKIYNRFLNLNKRKPLIILKRNNDNGRFGGYKYIKNGWVFTEGPTNFISLGSFFISQNEIKKRWSRITSIQFDNFQINGLKKEIMIDKDCFREGPIMAEILDLDTPFIDIGIPSSLHEAQNFIPEIIKGININDKNDLYS